MTQIDLFVKSKAGEIDRRIGESALRTTPKHTLFGSDFSQSAARGRLRLCGGVMRRT